MASSPKKAGVFVKILHLFSNHKFTGPADPALVLAAAQLKAGDSVTFAAGRSPQDGSSGVGQLARERGLPIDERLTLLKHARPWRTLRDVHKLRDWLQREPFDVIHSHLPNDHLIAALASRGSGLKLIRTLYDLHPASGWRARSSWRRTGGAVVFSDQTAAELRELEPSIVVERLDPPLDLDRFDHHRSEILRAEWGVAPGDFVVGVVARMQPHRRFPELIAGFAAAAERHPKLHLVVLGRGTHQERVAKEPARQSSMPNHIHFPGYIDPEAYPAALPCFDALIFLMPGSDGTCRAAREALASGVPIISSSRGLLPEMIEDTQSGLVLTRDEPEDIMGALLRLIEEPGLATELGSGARRSARSRFDAASHAEAITRLVERISDR